MFAGLLAFFGCGPRVMPAGPGTDPAGVPASTAVRTGPSVRVRPSMREVLLGEMCPRGAAGRPAVLPMFMRTLTWSAEAEDVNAPIARRGARQFSIMAWDGRRAGIFSVAGASDVGLERDVAVGAYAGVSPCTTPAGQSGRKTIASCEEAQADCGLALGLLEPSGGLGARPFDEEPEPAVFAAGSACVSGDKLVVDIDGDQELEAYPAAGFLNPIREPAEEVVAVPRGSASCAPAFAWRHVIPPGDPKHWRGLDLLGVVDIDGDGRRELVMSYHYSERRTWAVYSAVSSTGRLDLVGEAVPWPTR